MAATTRRRPWASSPARCSPGAISISSTASCRFRSGSSWPRTPRSRSARCRAAGGSSTRWGRASPSSTPVGGFAAETAGAISLFTATHLGVPVSTTHTITGAIIGVGSIRRLSAVRWGVAGRIVWAWVLTIPASAFIAAVVYWVVAQHDRTVARCKGQRSPSPFQSAASSTVKIAPPSRRFAALTRPSCSSTRCLTMARPSPVPPGSRSLRERALSTR